MKENQLTIEWYLLKAVLKKTEEAATAAITLYVSGIWKEVIKLLKPLKEELGY
jgi:hypothetical protein